MKLLWIISLCISISLVTGLPTGNGRGFVSRIHSKKDTLPSKSKPMRRNSVYGAFPALLRQLLTSPQPSPGSAPVCVALGGVCGPQSCCDEEKVACTYDPSRDLTFRYCQTRSKECFEDGKRWVFGSQWVPCCNGKDPIQVPGLTGFWCMPGGVAGPTAPGTSTTTVSALTAPTVGAATTTEPPTLPIPPTSGTAQEISTESPDVVDMESSPEADMEASPDVEGSTSGDASTTAAQETPLHEMDDDLGLASSPEVLHDSDDAHESPEAASQ